MISEVRGPEAGVRVVVAGAGFAGLMAAWRLAQGGCEVVVLEARDRVGGRVWSQELIPGDRRTVIERGAEFVLEGYDVLREVLGGLGLELAGTVMSYYQREPRGGGPVSAAEVGGCAAWVATAAAVATQGTSLAEVAAGWAGQPAALAAYLSRMETTAGVSADRLSAAVAGDATAGFGWRPSWRVAGGNQQVATGLAGRLGPAVRLASPVQAVQQDHRGVHLATVGGTVTGDAAVLAVPMAVLRRLPIVPAVPGRQRAAWARSGLAHNAKLHMPLNREPAASAVQSVPGRFWTWTAADQTGQVQPVLHAFAGTERGLSALAVTDGPATWAARAAALRPDLDADPARAVLTTWNDDPWAGQSYSADTLTAAPGDPDILATPAGRIYFAGEHTAGHWAGLMEGALRSGQRAASEVFAGAHAAS
ncbi:MAG TPA: NAD(P)/FAD-dependent oxidoreductase [Streptosporangiaceae bacterium]|nr:NAD(P)/FAD-dependent oxidoreductase [Streptosporangiaceae bacterium]